MTRKQGGKWIFCVIVLCLSMIITVGCSSNKTTSKDNTKDAKTAENLKPQSGGTITVGMSEEPDTLDIQKTAMSAAEGIGSSIGGTLLANDPKTMELKPYLAESYNVSEDGKTITFKLRKGVTFQDGTPLTAKAYKDTFDRILNPETGATLAASMVTVIKSVSAPDDQTLVVELKEPSAPFLGNLATSYLQPLTSSAIEKAGNDYGRNPVGVGPWKFKDWVTGQSITLERNDNYNWGPSFYKNQGKVYPDKLVYKFITDQQTMLAALDSGSIDILVQPNAKDAKRYMNNDKYQVLETDQQGLGLLVEMNLENGILSDLNVRKAINTAINKDAIIKADIDGEGKPANGPISSTIFGYDPKVESYGYKYNKEKATKLLEDSGWKKNSKGIMEKDGKELNLTLSIMDTQKLAAQMVQAMLKDIGIDVSIQSMEAGTLIEKETKGDYELGMLAYSYPDPDILYLLFHSSQIGGLNHDRVNNPELDALLEKERTTIDPNERKKVLAEAQKIIVENAYWAPIYTKKSFYIVNKRVHGVKISTAGLLLNDSWVSR